MDLDLTKTLALLAGPVGCLVWMIYRWRTTKLLSDEETKFLGSLKDLERIVYTAISDSTMAPPDSLQDETLLLSEFKEADIDHAISDIESTLNLSIQQHLPRVDYTLRELVQIVNEHSQSHAEK